MGCKVVPYMSRCGKFALPRHPVHWTSRSSQMEPPPPRRTLSMGAMMKWICVWLALMTSWAAAREYEVVTRNDVEYVAREDGRLAGDLYLPKGLDKAPVLVAVHGGGWQAGNRTIYKYWGPFLAKNGYAVFAISYRLAKAGAKSYPAAVYDVKAAVQFVRAKAGELGVDADRIALIGDSAGAHLAALAGLAAGEPQFSSEYQTDPHAATS